MLLYGSMLKQFDRTTLINQKVNIPFHFDGKNWIVYPVKYHYEGMDNSQDCWDGPFGYIQGSRRGSIEYKNTRYYLWWVCFDEKTDIWLNRFVISDYVTKYKFVWQIYIIKKLPLKIQRRGLDIRFKFKVYLP